MSVLGTLGNNCKSFNGVFHLQRCDFHTTPVYEGIKRFIQRGVDLSKYTLRPIENPKTGGRGADGRIRTRGIGGGRKRRYRMVDFKRSAIKNGPPVVEKVMSIQYDPNRSGKIAVVAVGERKRYILASENMKPGDLIETTNTIPRMSVVPVEGNAYPLGALPLGTMVHSIEEYVGRGGKLVRAGGTSAQLVRKVDKQCIIKLPSSNEIVLPQECMATVGRVSHTNHTAKRGRAGTSRWLGIRPQSGLYHKKTGIHGKKINPPKTYTKGSAPKVNKTVIKRFTL